MFLGYRGLEMMVVSRQAGGEQVNVVGVVGQHVLGLQGVGDSALCRVRQEVNMSRQLV